MNQCLYTVYSSTCPRCGGTESRDDGPYEYAPADDLLGGPPDPAVHLLWCLGCYKPYDAGPVAA
jgi:hypothetical protein